MIKLSDDSVFIYIFLRIYTCVSSNKKKKKEYIRVCIEFKFKIYLTVFLASNSFSDKLVFGEDDLQCYIYNIKIGRFIPCKIEKKRKGKMREN